MCDLALTISQVLERGLELLGSRPVVYRLNPKAMPDPADHLNVCCLMHLLRRCWNVGLSC